MNERMAILIVGFAMWALAWPAIERGSSRSRAWWAIPIALALPTLLCAAFWR